jgi:transposase
MAGAQCQTANHLNVVQQLVEEDNDATLAELCERIEQRTGVRVSQSTLFRVLQQLKLTRKKTFHATQAESERVQNLRREYWELIHDVRPEDLVLLMKPE